MKKEIIIGIILMLVTVGCLAGCVDELPEVKFKTFEDKIVEVVPRTNLFVDEERCREFDVYFENGMSLFVIDKNIMYIDTNRTIRITFYSTYGVKWSIQEYEYLN